MASEAGPLHAHPLTKAEEGPKQAAFGQVELILPNLEHLVNKIFQQLQVLYLSNKNDTIEESNSLNNHIWSLMPIKTKQD